MKLLDNPPEQAASHPEACRTPDKRKYFDRARAFDVICQLSRRPGIRPIGCYKCACGFWHLTSRVGSTNVEYPPVDWVANRDRKAV